MLATAIVVAGCSSPVDTAPQESEPSTAAVAVPTDDGPLEAAPGDGASITPTSAPTPTEAYDTQVVAMWARGGLPQEMVATAAALDDVVAVGFRRRENVGIVGVTAADGTRLVEVTDGWRYGARAIAVDPAAFGDLLGIGRSLAGLAPGTVALSASGAEFRGVGVGATIDIVDRPGLAVVAVVPDDTVGSNELILHHSDADALGWGQDGTLVIEHTRPELDTLRDELLALVPDDRPARVVDPDEGVRAPPLVLPTLTVKERFGEFAYRPRAGVREIDIDQGWVAEHIVRTDVPILGSVICHRGIIDAVRGALQTLVDRGLADTIVPAQFAGCSYARQTSTEDDASLSRHSWGIALDINVDLSQPGGGTPLPVEVIEVFRANGFRWGGDFLVPDNHHFEWVGLAAFAVATP